MTAESGDDGGQGFLHVGAEGNWGDNEGSRVGEEGVDGAGICGWLDVGRLRRGLEGLCSGEAAGVDKAGVWRWPAGLGERWWEHGAAQGSGVVLARQDGNPVREKE
jgi:hypothetical protein